MVSKIVYATLLLILILNAPACSEVTSQSTSRDLPTTGIEAVDATISAVLTEDISKQRDLLVFLSVPCTNGEGLGGPPKCDETQEDGTLVEVFPILGPEGHFMFKGQLEGWEGIKANRLKAVYQVSDAVFGNEFYPAGEYAILFSTDGEGPELAVHIRDEGIVRLDYHFGESPDEILQRTAEEIILKP